MRKLASTDERDGCVGAAARGDSPPPAGFLGSSAAEADFVARRTAPGVIRWFDFDSTAQLGDLGNRGANFGHFSNSNNAGNLPVIDSGVAASGAGSLRFDVRSQSFPDGAWFANFSPDLSARFGENSTFYVQWRQRFNKAFVDTVFLAGDGGEQGGIKQVIIGPGDTLARKWASCEAIHLVTQTYWQNRMVIGYNSCTGSGSHGPYTGFYTGDSDIRYQNGTPPYCLRSSFKKAKGTSPPPGCAGWVADEWMTFQVQVSLGQRSFSTDDFENSTYKLWIAREGKPSHLVIDWKPGVAGYFPLAAGPAREDQRFGKIWLLPYMTGKSPRQVHPLAQTWYDEVIISTRRIPDPVSSMPPNLRRAR